MAEQLGLDPLGRHRGAVSPARTAPRARGLSRAARARRAPCRCPIRPCSSTVLATPAARAQRRRAAARIAPESPTSASIGATRWRSVRRSTQFSRFRCERSRLCFTALRICDTRNGLRMKSDAPARSASIAVSRSAKAVIRITSPEKPCSRSSRSQVMPFLPGSVMSRITRSKRWARASRSAASALPAAITWPQRFSSVLDRKLRMPSSSSTISTALRCQPSLKRSAAVRSVGGRVAGCMVCRWRYCGRGAAPPIAPRDHEGESLRFKQSIGRASARAAIVATVCIAVATTP